MWTVYQDRTISELAGSHSKTKDADPSHCRAHSKQRRLCHVMSRVDLHPSKIHNQFPFLDVKKEKIDPAARFRIPVTSHVLLHCVQGQVHLPAKLQIRTIFCI